MPYVTITASQGFSAAQKKQLLQSTSDAVVQSIGAKVEVVRVMLNELAGGHYLNAGQFDTKALMFQVELITGRTEQLKSALMSALSRAGSKATGVPESQVRVRVMDYPLEDMGVAGGISAKVARG
jgi:4-oxalocrotonate tautomerase family enzyme